MCPYILEGWIVDLWNCYIGQKLTEKEDIAVFAWRDGSFQTIPTIQQGGWQNLCFIWGKGMNLSTAWNWIQLKILCTTCTKAQSRGSCHQQYWTSKLTDQAKLYISFDLSVILKKDLPNRMRYYVNLLSWLCFWIKTKHKIALPFLLDVKIKCSDNSGTLICRCNFSKKKSTKTTMKTPYDRLCIPAMLFAPLDKYLTCYTRKSKKGGTKLPKSTVCGNTLLQLYDWKNR